MTSQLSLAIAFAGVAALSACSPTTAPSDSQKPEASARSHAPAESPAPGPRAQPASSIASALPNAVYLIDMSADGKAELKDGLYEEPIPGSSSRNVVRLGPEPAYGDLDGDRDEDAAVTLLASAGGSGSFTYVTAVLNQNGVAEPVPSVLIGDRVTMKSLRIAGEKLEVTWLERKTDEPMSTAPRFEASQAFVVQGGKLVLAGPVRRGAGRPR